MFGLFKKKSEPEATKVSEQKEAFDFGLFEERKEKVKICLTKKSFLVPTQVQWFIDCSGSMNGLYRDGSVQKTFERMLPVAAQLDNNGELEVYSFDTVTYQHPVATVNNAVGYVKNNIVVRGSTNYEPIIRQAMLNARADMPTLAIVVTDGDCWDKDASIKAIKEASKLNLFFVFIGIGSEKKTFLQEIDDMQGRFIDNVDFFEVGDLNSITDDTLYEKLMTEYPHWYTQYQNLINN